MVIVYNPTNGSPIPPFNFEGQEYFDQNNREVLLPVGELLQIIEPVAQDMVERWPFLQIVTAEKALEIKAQKNWIKCEECDVTFKPEAKAAMESHKEKHVKKEGVEEVVLDIPQAQGIEATPNKTVSERVQADLTTGSDFYGPGLTETRGI